MNKAPTALKPSPAAATSRGATRYALLAEFEDTAALVAAVGQVRRAGYTRWDAYSPFPVHGIDEAMGIRPTKLPWVVFLFGFTGCMSALLLQWWTNASNPGDFGAVPTFLQGYNFLISGKPYFSLPANIPVIFELTVLFAALAAGIGMLVFNNLPRFHNPLFSHKSFARVTTDRFFIAIEADDPLFDEIRTFQFLQRIGGNAIEQINHVADDGPVPRAFVRAGAIAACAALIPLALIAMARASRSDEPRIHLVQNMDNQPKYQAQQALAQFEDGRAMRLPVGASLQVPVELTVARGELQEDDHYYRGYRGPDSQVEYFRTFPTHRPEVELTESFVRRGQDRFNIYCAPCHGRDGSGHGMVNQRAAELGPWVPASNLHDDTVRGRPVGHLFNTITKGIRTMPAYGAQIPPEDRWAIVAYLRALQRSTHGELDELPEKVQEELKTR